MPSTDLQRTAPRCLRSACKRMRTAVWFQLDASPSFNLSRKVRMRVRHLKTGTKCDITVELSAMLDVHCNCVRSSWLSSICQSKLPWISVASPLKASPSPALLMTSIVSCLSACVDASICSMLTDLGTNGEHTRELNEQGLNHKQLCKVNDCK